MAITTSMQPESARTVYTGSDFPHPFQFCFSKEGMGHAMQNQPRSDQDGLAMIWLHSSGLKASWCAGIIRPSFWQDATCLLPVSHFQTRLCFSTHVPDTVQNQLGADLVLADCARLGPNGFDLEERQCARIIRPASGQGFPTDLAQMRIRSGMFTGQERVTHVLTCSCRTEIRRSDSLKP